MRIFLSLTAIALTFAGYYPYVRSIITNQTRPHVFTWIVWGLTTFIVFFAQLEGGGGMGAWPIGASGAIAIGVAVLAWLKRGDGSITRSDWFFFVLALASLPVWYFTDAPLWSVVILTAADVLGFGPTLRKAYHHPFEENLVFFGMFTVRNVIAIGALEQLTPTTLIFPGVTGVACALLVLLVSYRRQQFRKSDRAPQPHRSPP